jgi:hypothetical protein
MRQDLARELMLLNGLFMYSSWTTDIHRAIVFATRSQKVGFENPGSRRHGTRRNDGGLSGSRPGDLSDEEGAAYDVAHALVKGGILPEPTFRCALGLFGQAGLNELIYLVGHYCFVSVTLNGFDIPVPA